MSNVQGFINRQFGICNAWKHSSDTAISRLRCTQQDDYSCISIEPTDNPQEPPVFACKFAQQHGHEHMLALANEDGQLTIHNTEHKDTGPQRYGKTAHYNAIFDVAWLFGQMKLVSVSGDHTARLFDVSREDIIEERIFHGHSRSVKTVACRRDDPAVFATGARDGAIFVWDTRANLAASYVTQPDRIISNSHNIPNTPSSGSKFRKKTQMSSVSGANSVTGLVFQDDMTLISCGAGDGVIKVWDLRKNYGNSKREPIPKNILPYTGHTTRNGFSNLLIDHSGLKLFASCMDNNIYCYNIATYQPEPIMAYSGHQNSSFYVKASLSHNGRYLVSGSGDNNAYIWHTDSSTPMVRLSGHTAEVTCVSWCPTSELKLVTCADDMHHKIWRIYYNPSSDDQFELRGSAIEFHASENYEPRINNKFATPSGSKKRISGEITPHSQKKRARTCEKCQMLTPGSAESFRINCENCVFISRSGKRSSSQAKLSPPDGDQGSKRLYQGGARRLFSTYNHQDCSNILAVVLEENSPDKPNMAPFSPTANLPNFVIDGEAPHLRNFSPQKKQDKDWLTKIRIEQNLRNQMDELSRPSSPKQPRLLVTTSPKVNHPSGKKQKKASGAQSPLLKFFRITNNTSRSNSTSQCLMSANNNSVHSVLPSNSES